MVFAIESVVLCLVFTLMAYLMSREPIKTLYNYPPKIQERVRTLPEYKDQIPTQKNKLAAKAGLLRRNAARRKVSFRHHIIIIK